MNPSTPPSGQPITDADLAVITWLWIFGLSMLGGVASFLQKLKSGYVRAWNFTEFIGEITASGLTGIITANLCDAMNVPAPMKYALVGISSHMGSRALFKLEALFTSKFSLPADPLALAPAKEDDHAA
jgi:hypothetical protein